MLQTLRATSGGWKNLRTGQLVPAGTGGPTERPVGPNYVRYEDTYVSGDTLQDTINRVTGNRVLTFPEGVFLLPDNFSNGYLDGVRLGHPTVGAGCRGFAGSGRNTIFKMLSSNRTAWASGASPYMLIDAVSPSAEPMINVEFRNFRIEGTDLGHEYHGLRLDRANGLVENVYITGISGFNKVPPGETGSISIFKTTDMTIRNVEVDGRRNGERVSSACIMPNNSSGLLIEDVYLHHTKYGGGGIAWFHTTDSVVNNARVEYIGSGSGLYSAYSFNHEQSTRIVYNSPKMICDRNNVGGTLHMGVNSDGARGGTDCIITVNNPTWDATSVGSGRFCVETWTLDQQMQRTPPIVTGPTGAPLEYFYINPYANGGVQN